MLSPKFDPKAEASRPRFVVPRRDTTANWEAANPVLQAGEFGLDYTRGVGRIGDGATAWNDLPDFTGSPEDPCLIAYA
jgi:hypothetical protein